MSDADLQGSDGCALETQVGLEVLGDFSHQALEGQLADQQLSGLLVTTDLTQSHSTRPGEERQTLTCATRAFSQAYVVLLGREQKHVTLHHEHLFSAVTIFTACSAVHCINETTKICP